jgi:MMP 1-O-methyltransferase
MTSKCCLAEELEVCLRLSETIPGWTRGEEARELLRISHSLSAGAILVEIGSFLGASAILLAGPRRICGSGLVHCVDPFDGTGDSFSVPHYERILAEFGSGSLRDHFQRNIHNAGLGPWVRIHQGRADEVARSWTTPLDLLYLDGDQSRTGAREAYDGWVQFLKAGGIIAVHNSAPENYTAEHDGHRFIVEEEIKPPCYNNIRLVCSTTFAMKEAYPVVPATPNP